MTDVMVTLAGNVATAVEYRESATGGRARFRFAVPSRRWDRQRDGWTDGPTSFYTVWAWRALGANLAASVAVGEPLVVHGRLRVREEEWEGRLRTSVDIDAVAAGHDLARGTSAFRRVTRAEARLTGRQAVATEAAAPPPAPPPGAPAAVPPFPAGPAEPAPPTVAADVRGLSAPTAAVSPAEAAGDPFGPGPSDPAGRSPGRSGAASGRARGRARSTGSTVTGPEPVPGRAAHAGRGDACGSASGARIAEPAGVPGPP